MVEALVGALEEANIMFLNIIVVFLGTTRVAAVGAAA